MSDAEEPPTEEPNKKPSTAMRRRWEPSMHGGRRVPSTTGSRRGVPPSTPSGRRGIPTANGCDRRQDVYQMRNGCQMRSGSTKLWWSASEEQSVDSQASEAHAVDRWWTVLLLQTSTTSEDRLTVLEGMMMNVRNDLQARCMTAWGTQRMDNLKAEGPLALRGARTPERQPTEPTPGEIEGVHA